MKKIKFVTKVVTKLHEVFNLSTETVNTLTKRFKSFPKPFLIKLSDEVAGKEEEPKDVDTDNE